MSDELRISIEVEAGAVHLLASALSLIDDGHDLGTMILTSIESIHDPFAEVELIVNLEQAYLIRAALEAAQGHVRPPILGWVQMAYDNMTAVIERAMFGLSGPRGQA